MVCVQLSLMKMLLNTETDSNCVKVDHYWDTQHTFLNHLGDIWKRIRYNSTISINPLHVMPGIT